MSKSSKSKGFAEPRGRFRAVSRRRSSSGVDVVLKGWRSGLNKVELTLAFREGGSPLREAVDLTARVLEGHKVRAHLAQFSSVIAARRALTKIGVAEIGVD